MQTGEHGVVDTEMPDVATSESVPRTLSSLPDEIITAILGYLDARSVTRIGRTSRRFLDIAAEAVVWQRLCLSDFRFWDTRHQFQIRQHDRSCQEWKALYTTHNQAHIFSAKTVQQMIDEPQGRLNAAQTILNLGYDAKDTLLKLVHDAPDSESPLAQRYWASTVLGCLNRSIALEQWNRIKFRSDIEHPMELALASLDMFILENSWDGDIDDIFRQLDSYAASVRAASPDIDEQTPRQRAITIAEHLRAKKWVGIEEGADYYSLENMFLSNSLHSQNRNSLPLISAVIYSYVCRRFDLRASPISYPMHVHTLIQPAETVPPIDLDGNTLNSNEDLSAPTDEPSSLTHLYMDPFHSSSPLSPSNLTTRLRFMIPNTPTNTLLHFLSPTTPRELLIRNARNIINSLTSRHHPGRQQQQQQTSTPGEPSINRSAAAYAALYASVLHPSTPENLPRSIADLTQHFLTNFPFDLANYRQYILPLTSTWPDSAEYRDLVRAVAEDDVTPKAAKTRNAERERARFETGNVIEEVKYCVGTVFRHRRRGYLGVIWGWDPICRMSERWIVGNGVDTLPRGRGQPFYNVLVNDETTRYVAQENVEVLEPEEFGDVAQGKIDVMKEFGWEVGRWFRRWDQETGRFISNVRSEYPED